MESKMFLYGRFFKIADRIHKEYCINNGKTMPRRLVGNLAYEVALKDVVKGMLTLSDNLFFDYKNWAEFYPDYEWLLDLLGETANRIHELEDYNNEENYENKAQLLLGYLAELPGDPEN